MHRLAVLSMRNRALIALITICAALFGGVALTNLKQELIPSVDFPQLAILSTYPGASPAVVAHDVSTPVETAVQGVPGLSSTSAVSSSNQSLVTVQFDYGTNLDTVEQKLNQAISQISSTLPTDVTPQVIRASLDDLPVIQIAATGESDTAKLGDDITRLVLPDIKKTSGVSDAQLIGLAGNRVTITPDTAKLATHGLSTQSITSALQQNGVLVGAGALTEGDKSLTVQTGEQLTSLDDLKALPLVASAGQAGGASASASAGAAGAAGAASTAGAGAAAGADAAAAGGLSTGAGSAAAATPVTPPAPTKLGDVASVKLDTDPQTSLSRVDGKPALTIAVTKLPSANTVEVSNAVQKLLPDFESKLGDGVKLTTVFDQAPFITQSINSLAEEGLLGLGFAVVVILVFLLSVRSTLVTAISIPTSVLITFIAMWASGYTLNIITLGGLTIAIGRVVDDSIVVIENIKRHLKPGITTPADRAKTVITAVREVAGAITASTVTTVTVFLPIAFVGDVTGELFRPFALTVTIALLASLLVALTIVPVLAYWFLRAPKEHHRHADAAAADAAAEASAEVDHADDDLEKVTWLQRGYRPIITWTLRRSKLTIALAALVLVGTAALSPLLTTNFLGDSGQNTLTVTQTLPAGSSLDAKNNAAKPVEQLLLDTKGVKTVQTAVGGSGSAIGDAFGGGSGGTTFSVTTDASADQDALQKNLRDKLKKLSGVGEVELSANSGFGGSSDIAVDLTAPDDATLQKASAALVKKLETYKSLDQVSSNLSADLPYIAVDVDRAKAAQAGFTEVALGQFVSTAMQPTQVGQIAIDSTTLKIYLANADAPTTLAQLKDLQVPTAAGPVALSTLANVHETTGPARVTTQKGLRTASVTASPVGQDLTKASADVNAALAAVKLPAGATAAVGGVQASQSNAFSQLGLALLAAILIVYIVMVATFKSLRQPLLLLVSVPFAATGAILLQIVSGIPLGVASLIGVLMLIGIVVTNAIVLVDLVNQYRARGMSVPDAVLHGASRRLRPILMTALATIFALTPMAVGLTGHGSFISQPLAIVVIGGLVSSTVLTLVVLPTLYNLVEGARERRAAKRAAATGAGAPGRQSGTVVPVPTVWE